MNLKYAVINQRDTQSVTQFFEQDEINLAIALWQSIVDTYKDEYRNDIRLVAVYDITPNKT